MTQDKLLFGKDNTQFITSVEIENDRCTVFREVDGKVETHTIPNKFWLLSGSKQSGFTRLKGDLHFKWGRQSSSAKEFFGLANIYRQPDGFVVYDTKEQLLIKDGLTYFKGLTPKDVSILSFDIETLGLQHTDDNKILLISNTYRCKDKIVRKLFAYDDYKTEAEMLDEWCKWVCEMNPSIVCGHNIYGFDLPMLEYIARRSGTELKLGRNGYAIKFNRKPSQFRIDGSREQAYFKANIYGRELVDTMFLAVRYDIGKKYESYGLKPIVKQEGLEVKDRQFYDASTIRFNYTNPVEWEKIKTYCVHDSDDALALFDLMVPAQFYWCQMVPKSFQGLLLSATGSQINSILIRSYLQEGHSIPKADDPRKFEGAISFGKPGVYSNMLKIDLNSLYPSIIVEYDVYDCDKDPNANFLTLAKKLRENRLINKKLAKETGNKYYSDLEQTQKVAANSLYGALGAPGLNFNCVDGAEFITAKGREILTYTIKWATGKELKDFTDVEMD